MQMLLPTPAQIKPWQHGPDDGEHGPPSLTQAAGWPNRLALLAADAAGAAS